jgi:putative tryptophan/tyrosine transport system substrate-binding protein
MRRRDVIELASATLAAPISLGIFTRPSKAAELPKLGLIHPGPKGPIPSVNAVVAGLADLGYVDGKTVTLEYRYGENKPEQLLVVSRGLLEQNVKIIVAVAGDALIEAAKTTTTVPIVSATGGGDFVAMGLIKDWDHPGTNVTGMNLVANLAAIARIEILKASLPGIKKIAVIADLSYPGNKDLLAEMQTAAAKSQIELDTREVSKKEELEEAIIGAKHDGAGAIAGIQGPFYFFQRKLLAELSLKHEIPLAASEYGSAQAGAFLQVNPDIAGCARRSGGVVDMILKGAKPEGIKVERWSNYDVVFNRTTAKTLRIDVGPSLFNGANFVD